MEVSLTSDPSFWLSFAAFAFSIYSLWLTRKERRSKLYWMQDYQIAEPLFNIQLDKFLTHKRKRSPEMVNNLFAYLNNLQIKFHSKEINKTYQKMLKDLWYLGHQNPNRQGPKSLNLENGDVLIDFKDSKLELYYTDVEV